MYGFLQKIAVYLVALLCYAIAHPPYFLIKGHDIAVGSTTTISPRGPTTIGPLSADQRMIITLLNTIAGLPGGNRELLEGVRA